MKLLQKIEQHILKTQHKDILNFLLYLKLEKRYSSHTIKNYEQDLYHFTQFIKIEAINWSHFTINECTNFLYHLENKKYAKKTIHRHISSLRSFWAYLISKNKCIRNPWKFVKASKYQRQLPYILSSNEIKKILDMLPTQKANEIRNKCICELLYSTGMRVSELTNIRMNKINWNEHEIVITGKGNKQRIVLFGKTAKLWLQTYINHARPKTTSSNNYLFLNRFKTQLTERSVQRLFNSISSSQNLTKPITPHTLRHCFATDLYEGGADIRTIQQLLGHKNINSTNLYTHLSTKHLKKIIDHHHPRA